MDRSIDVRLGGKVHDRIDSLALHDFLHRFAIADVALDERKLLAVCDGLQTGNVAGVSKRIEADNDVGRVMLHPVLDEIAADKTCSSCNQHSTHRVSYPRSYSLCLR